MIDGRQYQGHTTIVHSQAPTHRGSNLLFAESDAALYSIRHSDFQRLSGRSDTGSLRDMLLAAEHEEAAKHQVTCPVE